MRFVKRRIGERRQGKGWARAGRPQRRASCCAVRTIPHRCVWQKGTRACALFQPVCLVLRPPNFREAGKQTRRGRRLGARTPPPLLRRLLRSGHHTPQQRAAEARARAPRFGTCLPCPLSPKFQSRLEQTFTCWEPGARGPPSATRLLLCGAHHATQQPVAEACALVPLFLWVMLLQRWTIFFAALAEGGGTCQVATHGGQIPL